ncbi:TBC1 domain family member 15-like isoform X2 [Eriocheir sinensis]|uniref:TBC1 domain family member 15-like isoform X2 n=1 Tax=Eriocheir sinensis TaxID=95602 RepID=UPI0021C69F5F|nr:TBC1 domain family member 15-like isoform X2 [Eriocheir sinensis]
MLVYEQDEVYTIPTSPDELTVSGKLRIIERRNGVVVEWRCADDENSTDSDWAVINSAAVTFTHHNISDSVEISTSRRNVRPISIELVDLRSYRIGQDGSLVLIQRDGTTHPALAFHTGSVLCFVEVLLRYVVVKKSEKDCNLYLVSDKKQAAQDEELLSMNLVPNRRGPIGPGGLPQSAPQRVWGFLNNFKRDPYTTTATTLSKFYDVVLYAGVEDNVRDTVGREDDMAEIFHSLNGFEDLEPGFEMLTEKRILNKRPEVERLAPMTHDEFQQYVDDDGRVLEVDPLKQRIFKGGIHPNLRRELWCYLLGHYVWNQTYNQREERKREKENSYYIMKQQWKTISEDQESRFNGFKERRSLIEKDVNRTDRNHPFFEGEHNTNVTLLHDVLMTYVMYNFDLGYVQGMSDLLAPILYVTQDEATAFWCFVGYMDMVYRNFDMDQSGMKQQLKDVQQLVRLVDPELMSYLEARDSSNFYFCFRWLLVRFKRELNYASTLRLWEVLWTGYPCPNFHLVVAVALLDTEKDTIMENKFGFTEILKHINDISLRIDIDATLKKAEAIYLQVKSSSHVPESVATILNLPQQDPQPSSPWPPQQDGRSGGGQDGGSEVVSRSGEDMTHDSGDVVEVLSNLGIVGVVSSMIGSAVRHLSGDDDMTDAQLEVPQQERQEEEREARYETALSHQFV